LNDYFEQSNNFNNPGCGNMTKVVQKLTALQRPELLRQLLALSTDDRRLRFGALMQDAAIARYVDGIDFERDQLFGIFGLDMHLAGAAHLALDREQRFAELGLSVNADERGQGLGFALLQRAKLHAVNLGFRTLFMYCLAENQTMVHLARKAGLKVVTEQGSVDANLLLASPSYGAVAQEAVEDQIALVDLFWKQQLQWLTRPVHAA
jgi:RimJ/RimL family protein N-acetyltransferase